MMAYKPSPLSEEPPTEWYMCKFLLRGCFPRGRYNSKETLYQLGCLISSPFQATAGIKGKGRVVAKPLPPSSSDLDDDEIIPDSELEFEDLENAVQNESSDDSSDDFVPEGSSESDVPQDRESDVPLGVSMATPNNSTRHSFSRAGPSSKPVRGRGPAAKMQFETESPDPDDSDDSIAPSKKAPRRKQTAPARRKGKSAAAAPRRPDAPGRGRGRRAKSDESDQDSDINDGLLEPSDDDAKPPPSDLQPHQLRTVIKAAERKMRKKLGRKLTMVQLSPAYFNRLTLTVVLLLLA